MAFSFLKRHANELASGHFVICRPLLGYVKERTWELTIEVTYSLRLLAQRVPVYLSSSYPSANTTPHVTVVQCQNQEMDIVEMLLIHI